MDAKFTFRFTAGAFVRSKLKFEVESYCAREGLQYNLTESRGLVKSDFQFVISGPAEKVTKARADLVDWLKKLEKI